MKALFSKILTLLIWLRYPKMVGPYRWFLRFRYLGRIRQYRYWVKDYLVKTPYKDIEFHGEFQQELLHVLPFAYWHYLNGTLKSTCSTRHTEELYFFSPNHIEKDWDRDYKDNFNIEIPNAPHDLKLDLQKWKPIPYKEKYANDFFKYDKDILVVANRFNTEWEQNPISYFDLAMLDQIFGCLKDKYQIIYNRPPALEIVGDNSEVQELGDHEWIKSNHPSVIQMVDLIGSVKEINNYNHLQLMVYANSKHFISIHGGTATLASYFGGTNIIYSKKGHEHYLKEFENIFPQLSSAKIYHAKDQKSLMEFINHVHVCK